MKFRGIAAAAALILAFAAAGTASEKGPLYLEKDYVQFGITSYAFTEEGKSVFPLTGNTAPRSLAVNVTVRLNETRQLTARGTLELSAGVRSFRGDEATGVLTESEGGRKAQFTMRPEESNNSATPADSYGREVSFYPESEAFLPGTGYSYKNDSPSRVISGKIPHLRATREQIANKCVPYIELKKDPSGRVTGFDFRFVDPSDPGTPLKKSKDNNVWGLGKYEVSRVRGGRYEPNVFPAYYYDMGGEMKTEIKFEEESFQQDEIHFIQVRFKYDDAPDVVYEWNIFVNPTPNDLSAFATAAVIQPKKEDIKSDIKVLLNIDENKFDLVKPDKLEMNKISAPGVDAGNAVSVVSFEQGVDAGGAVVLGQVGFTANPLKLNGKPAPDASDEDALLRNYNVYKIFENGPKIDLLALYPDQFSVEGTEVKFGPCVIAVDNKAPDDAVKTAGKYGVKLSGDEKYLLVFDGEADGNIADPFEFAAKPANASAPDGSGGCAAGFGVLPLAAAAIAAIARRKRR
jgi:hypothetical protein